MHLSGRPWLEVMLEEVALDPGRMRFCGRLQYLDYLAALQGRTRKSGRMERSA
jgi:hypothetical protein